MNSFTAIVVGLGQIGQGYDLDSSDGTHVTTHASGFYFHPGFSLVAGVDPDPAQRARFEQKYAVPAYQSLADVPEALRADVVSIAVPTPHHEDALAETLKYSPRAILCEKPIAVTAAQAERMVAAARSAGSVLLVNYMRRFEPGVLELRARIADGEFGEIFKGVVGYSKGLVNNGSHFVDLLTFLLGTVTESEILSSGRRWGGVDPEPDAKLRFGAAEVYFLAAREECYSLAEFELFGTRGRIAYRKGGASIQYWKTADDPDFPGYTVLDAEAIEIRGDFMRYQWHVADHLHRHLLDGTPLNSTGDTALATLEVIDQLVSQF